MKKIIAVISVLAYITLLCACGQETAAPVVEPAESTMAAETTTVGEPTTTTDLTTETTASITTAPATKPAQTGNSKPKAVMEPQQGGLYYYTYTGRNGKIGLIDQNGKVVVEPQFDRSGGDRVTDRSGKAVGIVMSKGTEHAIYYFDGSVKKINEKILYFGSVYEGGRYAEINPLNASSSGCGIYDLQEEKYVIKPKKGQSIGWNASGILFTRPDDEKERQWIFNINDGSLRQAPERIRGLNHHNGNAGWYQTYQEVNDYEYRYYDSEFNEFSALRGWDVGSFWWDTFSAGEHEAISRWHRWEMDGGTIVRDSYYDYAFVNRKGEIVRENRYTGIGKHGNFFQVTEKDGTILFLDGNLNELGKLKKGERIEGVNGPGNPAGLHIDSKGNVIRAIGRDFETLRNDAVYIGYTYPEDQSPVESSNILYRMKDGKWTKLDLSRYLKDKWQRAHAVVHNEDFVVVCVQAPGSWEKLSNKPTVSNMSLTAAEKPAIAPMTSYYIPPDVVEIFTVDWNGKRIKNSPFEPFYKDVEFFDANTVLPNVGWPYHGGPHYFWVETSNKRGYVNIKGEWLFVDNTK